MEEAGASSSRVNYMFLRRLKKKKVLKLLPTFKLYDYLEF